MLKIKVDENNSLLPKQFLKVFVIPFFIGLPFMGHMRVLHASTICVAVRITNQWSSVACASQD